MGISFRNVIQYLLILFLLLANVHCISNKSSTSKSSKPEVTLTLIHFNDGESKLLNAHKGLEDFGGVARFAAVINNIRTSVENDTSPHCHIAVSSGDNFLAGPEFDVSLKKGVPYYDAMAIDIMGVNAMALGNHDFDFGPEVLADFIRSFSISNTIFMSSNLDFSNESKLQVLADQGKIAKSIIIKRKNHRFGIIGLTTPNLPFISSPRNVKLLDNIASCVQKEVDILENKDVKKIILISHLQGIKEDIELIKNLRGIDIVVSGGGNELLANESDILISHDIINKKIIEEEAYGPYPVLAKDRDNKNVPVVTTTGEYRYVGLLKVSFNKNGEIIEVDKSSGPVRVVGEEYKDGVKPDSAIVKQVVAPLKQALNIINNKEIGTSQIDLDGNRMNVRSRETSLGSLAADALLWSSCRRASEYNAKSPDIALVNSGSIRKSIAAGTVTEMDVFNACPFSSLITIVENVSPEILKNLLENTYSRINDDGGIESASGTGRFAQIAGFRVVYNSKREAGNRIKEVRLDKNRPIVLDYKIVENAPSVNLATINFLARGGDEWNVGKGLKVNLGITNRRALSDYIKAPKSEGGLNGKITSAEYPDSGSRRILRINEGNL